MPLGIRTGQQFEVVVRRISTKRGKVTPPPPPPPPLQSPPPVQPANAKKAAPAGGAVPGAGGGALACGAIQVAVERPPLWRYVVGSFVVRIPVSTSKAMLTPEAMTLAFMK